MAASPCQKVTLYGVNYNMLNVERGRVERPTSFGGSYSNIYNVSVTMFPDDDVEYFDSLIYSEGNIVVDLEKGKGKSQLISGESAPSILNDLPFYVESVAQGESESQEQNSLKVERPTSFGGSYSKIGILKYSFRNRHYNSQFSCMQKNIVPCSF